MDRGATILALSLVIFAGRVWIDVVDILRYRVRVRMCIGLLREATELFERYADRDNSAALPKSAPLSRHDGANPSSAR
jgi:ABC-type Na+ transport system ATPase subunit NatA